MAPPPLPADDLVAPFLLGAFRLLDRIFSGGQVTASFQLDQPKPITQPTPRRSSGAGR